MMEALHEVFDPAGPEFWVLVATLIVLALAWKIGGFAQIAQALDKRGETVARELAEARALREEAQALLAAYQKKQKEAEAEAEALIASARAEAERFKAESAAKVQDLIARRTKLSEQKIAQAEQQAVAEVRSAAADAAVTAAASILSRQGGGSLMDSAIGEIKAKLN